MHCIGDECPDMTARPPAGAAATARAALLRSVAVGAVCAACGYVAAYPGSGAPDAAHLASLAPPMVMVSQLGN